MMAPSSPDKNVIAFRAPDVYLSGLLSVAFASDRIKTDGELDTFLEQESTWYLAGVLEGSARVTCELGCILLSDGAALAVCAQSPMDILFHGTGRLFVLCLKGSLAGSILRESDCLGGSIYPGGAVKLRSALEQLRREEAAAGSVSAPFASAIAYETLMALYGTGSRAMKNEKQLPQVVETALKILQQDFAFLDGIGDLAQRLQVSQEYLTRIFREYVGMTPGKYLVQVRVEQAKLLLEQGDHSIAFVADACGFTNGNYFARVFRSIVGVTPSVYQREHGAHAALPHPMLDSIYVL